ncbi:30S ribosome-binding factor RbfA [Polycladidibacter hongkongensis]|uniref:30S ribosome-binding factor RbfA n=1 Tax=Polycladidibacter hongkongensis TaxID=1647556 RepID=UPI0008346D12|nr:30S ribosome-binding factor RbfA [Pseudovibrio hongkongensis]
MAKPHDEFAGQPSQRQLRVGELVRKELSDILSRGQLADPDLDGVIITIPEVRMSPDLRWATVLVMPLGGGDIDRVLAGLKRSSKYLRGQVARRVTMKYSCDLRFVADTRFDDDDRINNLLANPIVQQDVDSGDAADEEE